ESELSHADARVVLKGVKALKYNIEGISNNTKSKNLRDNAFRIFSKKAPKTAKKIITIKKLNHTF
ncbi:MAG: hypothetical protein HRT87_06045, partial [Legionellales bacterium]|nr:hypothetical protein [Legionellales bacterium]